MAAEDAEVVLSAARDRLRGLVIDVTPAFGYTVSFALTHRIGIALPIALAVGIGVAAYRLARRESVWRALTVIGVVGVAGALAAGTDQAVNFYLPGLTVESLMAVVTPVLLLLGWPLLGLVMAMVTGEGTGWRRCAVRRRAFTLGTLAAYGLSLVLLTIRLSLFLSGQTVALGTVDVLGPFVQALGMLIGWRVYRRAVGPHRCETPSGQGETAATDR
ncbi:DUF3159 domain-containing protein [Kutzneria sp. CA-103260]|uniref:DUF3159 domain-containing protein n=1 Tax=Kutzneria sp. CA-103260 TaxID=2802641 RepID=UPI001BA4F472|nr:DUF3159 domain-containing protein [Kutzneria sp. CA-103260]QUQ72024.1 hypothetical protein JJ691_98110 [Kutzneria sp. CA-103260]